MIITPLRACLSEFAKALKVRPSARFSVTSTQSGLESTFQSNVAVTEISKVQGPAIITKFNGETEKT